MVFCSYGIFVQRRRENKTGDFEEGRGEGASDHHLGSDIALIQQAEVCLFSY